MLARLCKLIDEMQKKCNQFRKQTEKQVYYTVVGFFHYFY